MIRCRDNGPQSLRCTQRSGEEAAVDLDDPPCEVVALHNELHPQPDLLPLPEPPQRHLVFKAFEHFWRDFVQNLCPYSARGNGANSDIVLRQLLRPYNCIRRQPRLGCAVVRLAHVPVACRGRDVDHDGLRFVSDRTRSKLSRAQKWARQIHADHSIPLLLAHRFDALPRPLVLFDEHCIAKCPSVVDKHVAASHVLLRLLEQGADILF
mmetsp:Transcript_19157/g.38999  ORF Transcript_19157/g.38999 Transcript_19157/m.38999 type:complete len:209 (-) Transcript_19157:228-854(-)